MRVDDDGLLQSLHEGMFETPLWQDFLNRLLAKTGAQFISLVFRPVHGDEDVQLYAAAVPSADILKGMAKDHAIAFRTMRPDRAYALDEVFDPANGTQMTYVQNVLQPNGLSHMRSIRVTESGGIDLWLTAFGGRTIGSATGALLTALAPHLRIALRSYAALERERHRSSVATQAIERLKMGWLTVDGQCRIIDATQNVEQLFQLGGPLRRGRYDRLVPMSPVVDRQLTALIKSYGQTGEGKSQAFRLSQDPWVDMLVTPAHEQGAAGQAKPAAFIYVNGDRWSQADRCEQLVDLFGLLPSEARLAWMMAQATSITEAADTLGLTIETARNYSKKIYAKTGARGQAELVRIVLTSMLAVT